LSSFSIFSFSFSFSNDENDIIESDSSEDSFPQ
jgi:hypothetical protein